MGAKKEKHTMSGRSSNGKAKGSRSDGTAGKFSKTGIVLIGSMLICLLICLCVAVPGGFGGKDKSKDLSDNDTPDLKTVVEDGTPILIYDKRQETKLLMEAFDEDEIASVTALYDDQSGSPVTTDDQDQILQIYKALKNIVVIGETDETATDAYHFVSFTLNDGTKCSFNFETTEILVIDDRNYKVDGGSGLWQIVQDM